MSFPCRSALVQNILLPDTLLFRNSYVTLEVRSVDPYPVIGLLQLTITGYKIRHAGGQAHYYSPTGTLEQRQVKVDWFRSLCFNVPVGE